VATAPKEPRLLSWRAEQVFWASNALLAHGHPVNPTLVRTLFNALHVLVKDRGNQWIGDALGGHGLHLPKDQKQNYVLPDEGIEPEYIIQYFLVPIDYKWDYDCEKYFPAAAALPPAATTTPKKPRQPSPPARPTDTQAADTAHAKEVDKARAEDTALAEDADTDWDEDADEAWVEGWRLVSEVCSTALAELQGVARLLREALSEHPSLAAAESGLLTASQLLATARRVEDELTP
jgi:hypothetical protein